MSIKEKLKAGGARATRAVMAGVLAFGLMPLPAYAADLQTASLDIGTMGVSWSGKQTIDPNDITAAAHAAANPAPEILGLNNPNYRSLSEVTDSYNFFGDPDVNTKPDPFMYNTYMKLVKKASGFDEATTAIENGRTSQAPMSDVLAWENDSEKKEKANQNQLWKLMPDIILGTGSDTAPSNESSYYDNSARYAEKANDKDLFSYNPIGVTYNRVTLTDMVNTMYRLATAANTVKKNNTSKKWRYDDPLEIAKNYERYILGQKGVVLQAINNKTVNKKKIALVRTYDAKAGTYGVGTEGYKDGTSTTDRYLEAVKGVTDNYYDEVTSTANSETGIKTVKADDLKKNVDVIITSSAAGSNQDTNVINALSKDGMLDRTYYCVNWASGSAFGTTVNSVENAQNVGRILPCVYPEVLDQSDMLAYYYDTFYHVKTGKIAELIGARMDGVRNWGKTDSSAYTTWEASDVTGYNQNDVQQLLVSGVSYLNAQSGLADVLKPTSNLSSDAMSIKDATITIEAAIPDANGVAQPEPTVVYAGKTLKKGTDYTVSYRGATAGAGHTATATITGAGTYSGYQAVEYSILSADNFVSKADSGTIEVTGIDASYQATGTAIEPVPTVKKDSETLTAGTDYVVSYSNNVKVAASTATNAPTVTIKGLGMYHGTINVKFSIAKGTQTITASAMMLDKDGDDTKWTLSWSNGSASSIYASSTDPAAKLTYTSSDPSVATVSEQGYVTPLLPKSSAIKITIKASATDTCAEATLEVPVLVTSMAEQTISVGADARNSGKVSGTYGNTVDLKATCATAKSLTYSSSDTSKATVDADGKITCKALASTPVTITITAPAKMATDGTTVLAEQTAKELKLTIAEGDISKFYTKFDTDWGYTGDDLTQHIGDNMTVAPSKNSNPSATLSYNTAFKLSFATESGEAVTGGLKDIGTYTMTIAGAGNYTGKITKTIKVVPYLTIYLQNGGDDPIEYKTFDKKSDIADLDAVKNRASGESVSGLYYKGGWNVSTAATYVTLDELLSASGTGIADAWKNNADAMVNYGGDASQGKASNTFTKDQLNNLKFYPKTTKKTTSTENAVDAPLVFALTEYAQMIGADAFGTAAATATSNLSSADGKTALRAVLGTTEADYLATPDEKGGAVGTAAGKRLWNNITSLTIIVPKDVSSSATITTDKPSYTYTGSAIKPTLTVKDNNGKTLTEKTDYTVAYSNNTNVGTGKATVTFKGNYKGTATANFSITGAAPTITASNASVAMGKTVAIGAKVNSGANLTYTSKTSGVATVNPATGVVTPVKPGIATITVTAGAKGNYLGATKNVTVTVTKGAQTVSLKAQSKKVKYSKVKKKAQTVSITKASGAQTTVTYSISKVSKKKAKFSINKKTGKITVKKKTPKGTYKVTVKATAAASDAWNEASTTAVIKVKVK